MKTYLYKVLCINDKTKIGTKSGYFTEGRLYTVRQQGENYIHNIPYCGIETDYPDCILSFNLVKYRFKIISNFNKLKLL